MDHNSESPPENTEAASNPLQKIEQIVPEKWRFKLAKAAAQLIAGSEKGAAAYGEIRERWDTIEGRSIVSKELAQAVAKQAINDPETMERAKARFLSGIMQKQENLEAVIAGAMDPPLALPPPAAEKVVQDGPTGADGTGEDSAEESDQAPLDMDWAASFAGIAENATSDELRQRLSQILAGELASPGTYSRSTVRQIAELEKSDLEAMQKVLPFVVDDSILRFEVDGDDVPSIDMLLPLAEAGLVTEATNMLARTGKPATKDGTLAWLAGKAWALRVTLSTSQSLSIPLTKLTKTGSAVVDLLGRADERPILKRFADSLAEGTFTLIELGKLDGPGRVAVPLERLRPKRDVPKLDPTVPFRVGPKTAD